MIGRRGDYRHDVNNIKKRIGFWSNVYIPQESQPKVTQEVQ